MLRLLVSINQFMQRRLSGPISRLAAALLLLAILNLCGTVMYMAIEGFTFIDALYMTVITVATVGFGEIGGELSAGGRVFTIVLIYLGVGLATTAVTNAVSLAVGPLLFESIRKRRLQNMIDEIKDHYIVCGYGRIGRQIVRDLRAREQPFVLVDSNSDHEEELLEDRIPYIIGDATDDDVLFAAGIERAKGIVAALSNDAGNIMTVLTARELNPNLFIVARAVRVESESKLRRAGADRVINPYQIGGHRMALSLLRPAVHDFMDHIFHFGDDHEIDIGQIQVVPGSRLEGLSIADSNLRNEHNVSILAVRDPNGHLEITPSPLLTIVAGMQLIIIGPPRSIYQLEVDYATDRFTR